MQYNGQCHCGDIQFRFEAPPITRALKCNCSICSRKGAAMSEFVVDGEQLDIQAKDDALGTYQFGTEVAKHHFCKNCGIYTFNQTARFPGKYRVNLGCVENVDVMSLSFDVFDGKNKL